MIRNPVPWPNGARCAVCFTLDMDAESILYLAHPRRAHGMVSAASMLRYGPQVAVPRILDSYRHYAIRQTFFVPGWCAERYPRAVEAMMRDGHEVSAHGYLHEHPNELGDAQERDALQRSITALQAVSGEKPAGWRAPLYNFSHRSAQLLLETGISYDASLMGDDVPYLLATPRGRLLELPSHWGMDDWPPFMHSIELAFQMPIQSAERAWETWWEEFEAMWAHGGLWVPVWHPFLSGRLARWRHTHGMIGRILEKGRVWLAPMRDIAAHVQRCIAEGTWTPRVESLSAQGLGTMR
ncbi:MAG TPA: polysaccharide deacetylase [Steroidobacteraceae bacterium]|nr:polysaccharide deacetylase [Steroidobacteraceae bacterium]